MLLRLLLTSFATFGGGFGALRASVMTESYILLVVGLGLLVAGALVLLHHGHDAHEDQRLPSDG